MTTGTEVWPTAADVPPSPFSVRARWPRGAAPSGGAHRITDPRPADDSPTLPLFTHPALFSDTEPVPGGSLD